MSALLLLCQTYCVKASGQHLVGVAQPQGSWILDIVMANCLLQAPSSIAIQVKKSPNKQTFVDCIKALQAAASAYHSVQATTSAKL